MSDAMAMINQASGRDKPLEVDGDEVRGRIETRRFVVDGALLAAYAGAVRDPAADRQAGKSASPAYAFAPLTELLFDVVARFGQDLGPTGVIHTHQDFTFHEPIQAGDELTVVAQVVDLRNSQLGGVVKIHGVTTRADGTELNSQLVTALVLGGVVLNPIENDDYAYVEPPAVGRPATGSVALVTDKDHAVRYAAASGDNNPIHLDAAYARNAGFPGTILHGMCTLALSASALEEKYPQFPVTARLGVEFTRPVFPGDRLTLKYTEAPLAEGGVDLFFEVLNRKQRPVMRGGVLRLTP